MCVYVYDKDNKTIWHFFDGFYLGEKFISARPHPLYLQWPNFLTNKSNKENSTFMAHFGI